MVDINKILQEKIDELEARIEKMTPAYDWTIKNGLKNYDYEGTAEPVITGDHVKRFYNLFHWNDISDDTLSSYNAKITKTENLMARIFKSLQELDDSVVTVPWIMAQLKKIYGPSEMWWTSDEE